MKLFKPYVNLIKSSSTGLYTLNSVVSVPKGYALSSLTQEEIEIDGRKLWAVTAGLTTNGSGDTELAEFSVNLNQGPTADIKTTRMIVENISSVSNRSINKTDVDYDDADIDV